MKSDSPYTPTDNPTWMIVRCFSCGHIWLMGRTICINCEGRRKWLATQALETA